MLTRILSRVKRILSENAQPGSVSQRSPKWRQPKSMITRFFQRNSQPVSLDIVIPPSVMVTYEGCGPQFLQGSSRSQDHTLSELSHVRLETLPAGSPTPSAGQRQTPFSGCPTISRTSAPSPSAPEISLAAAPFIYDEYSCSSLGPDVGDNTIVPTPHTGPQVGLPQLGDKDFVPAKPGETQPAFDNPQITLLSPANIRTSHLLHSGYPGLGLRLPTSSTSISDSEIVDQIHSAQGNSERRWPVSVSSQTPMSSVTSTETDELPTSDHDILRTMVSRGAQWSVDDSETDSFVTASDGLETASNLLTNSELITESAFSLLVTSNRTLTIPSVSDSVNNHSSNINHQTPEPIHGKSDVERIVWTVKQMTHIQYNSHSRKRWINGGVINYGNPDLGTQIHLVRNTRTHLVYAMKIIDLRGMTTTMRSTVAAELKVLKLIQNLNHPFLLQLHDVWMSSADYLHVLTVRCGECPHVNLSDLEHFPLW
jgi:hypothetical protein